MINVCTLMTVDKCTPQNPKYFMHNDAISKYVDYIVVLRVPAMHESCSRLHRLSF